jgi:hypothetical protein
MTSSRPSAGCGPPSASSRSSRSSVTTRQRHRRGQLRGSHGGSAADDARGARASSRAPCQGVRDPGWEVARQALDDLMRKLLVVHRLLEAEDRLAKREPRRNA